MCFSASSLSEFLIISTKTIGKTTSKTILGRLWHHKHTFLILLSSESSKGLLILKNAEKVEQCVGNFCFTHFDILSTKHWAGHITGILVKYLLKNE